MLIINGQIYTMEKNLGENGRIENGYVRINGKYIEEVGEMTQLRPKAQSETVLDVRGAWVMPGIIESHCHIGISEEKIGLIGDDCNEGTNPVTPTLRAIDAVNSFL